METMKLQKKATALAMLDPKIVVPAVRAALQTDPRLMIKSRDVRGRDRRRLDHRDLPAHGDGGEGLAFTFQIILWLWFTVLFANFAEAVAEGRGKAQADVAAQDLRPRPWPLLRRRTGHDRKVPGTYLKIGDFVVVEAGDIIPADGEVIEGIAASTSRRSPENPRRSSAKPAATARR